MVPHCVLSLAFVMTPHSGISILLSMSLSNSLIHLLNEKPNFTATYKCVVRFKNLLNLFYGKSSKVCHLLHRKKREDGEERRGKKTVMTSVQH
jgi:hypothetical protein